MRYAQRRSTPALRLRPRRKWHQVIIIVSWVVHLMGVNKSCAESQAPDETQNRIAPVAAFINQYCLDCHNSVDQAGNLVLEFDIADDLARRPAIWDRVIRKLQTRQMPPQDPRPANEEYLAVLRPLEYQLEHIVQQSPDPGRTETFRRLTRTEYANAIRDLLSVQIDPTALLPKDESSLGFDNITVSGLSPTLMERYVVAAQQISRLAVGGTQRVPGGDTIRLPADRTQEKHVPGLPLGTRGGANIRYTFPQDGVYEIRVRLARDRNEHVEGLYGAQTHELDMLLDRDLIQRFEIRATPDRQDHQQVDAHLVARLRVTGGPHDVGITFPKRSASLLETKRQPYDAHFNMHRHPRLSPAVFQISITGPYEAEGPGDTPSRRRIFVCQPTADGDPRACAEKILSTVMRRAYRREVTDDDLARPLALFDQAAQTGRFDDGIELALSAVLVNPSFLFRIEKQPSDATPGEPYQLSDVELATRLAFFLWSSIPDDELLSLALEHRLSEPRTLTAQTARMLSDEKSQSLVSNFATQWLHLRNLDSMTPDLREFPDFDDNLRSAFRRETELLLTNVFREDRSVLELLRADYTFLNERLARHYDVPHVYGSRFRRIELPSELHRGGILRQGSILTVTSYATRTSPVIRGKWILENLLGTPPPPPPPNVPDLKEATIDAALTVRERLAEHRANVACASCHNMMDPVGFALENYDAVGRWRDVELGTPIDATGSLADGSNFVGPDGLEQAILERPEVFVTTLCEKLLVFALGRGLDYHDRAAIRKVVREAASDEYRFSTLIQGIVASEPFRMRRAE